MRALVFGALLLIPSLARAAEPLLEVAAGGETRSYTREELLKRPDAATIEVAKDIAYGGPMTYRAVPVAALLSGLTFPAGSVIEAVAIDGFAAQIPLDLLRNTDASKAIAWVAIEPEDQPWPKIAGKDYTAGPLYVVWTGPEVASIRSEYWAYQLAKFESQLSPAARWPGLAVDPSLPDDDPVRAGQTLYIAQCLPCHKLNGGGASVVGPDLNLPMNPTQYMTPEGLHALIRDPKSVRSWPGMKMNGLPPDLLSDREIDLIVGYLKHMAGRKQAPPQ
ncbi:c-type cytochrome [Methyloceanibacter sp.]|uniref:c-type cytochrome n=1 Tax=Methyloceanibacter sp. TaxID=1965321 RepID=UPI003D6CE7DF